MLLPGRKQKHKTKVRPGENPSFMETFVFTKINPGKQKQNKQTKKFFLVGNGFVNIVTQHQAFHIHSIKSALG